MEDETLIEYGLINLQGHIKPMYFFNQTIVELIHKHKPEIIGWEDLKTNRNANTIRTLGRYTGILESICQELDIEYVQAIPISVKAAVCKKKGTKTKLDLAYEICNRYEEIVLDEGKIFKVHERGKDAGQEYIDEEYEVFNITDAVGIGLYSLYVRQGVYKPKPKSKKKKKKVIVK